MIKIFILPQVEHMQWERFLIKVKDVAITYDQLNFFGLYAETLILMYTYLKTYNFL